jgi:hypothetical protein
MKFHTLTTLCTIACAAIATADVPSLINYQGRLTDANGDPVTGSKNFAISIYDAATNGTLLYTETIGAVTLDDNGVYSFQFGGTGTSNTLVTETVATTNGTATTFQKVLDNSPVVANSVSVSDGTYTWSQSAGSSNEDQFGVAYSTSLRRVTANYYNGAPAAGRTITATYRYGTSGITGALVSGAEHWMAISVDGTTQGTRQRVLAVPFAHKSSSSSIADSLAPQTTSWRPEVLATTNAQWQNGNPRDATTLPFGPGYHGYWNVECTIPNSFSSLSGLITSYWMNQIYGNTSSTLSLKIMIVKIDLNGLESIVFQEDIKKKSGDNFPGMQTKVTPISVLLDQNLCYKLRVEMSNGGDSIGLRDIKLNGISLMEN